MAPGECCRTDRTLALTTAIQSLDTMPNRNRLYEGRTKVHQGLRFFPVDNYLVFYKTDDETETVYVVRIMSGGRDVHRSKLSQELEDSFERLKQNMEQNFTSS